MKEGKGREGKLDRIAKLKESFSVCFFCILEQFDDVRKLKRRSHGIGDEDNG